MQVITTSRNLSTNTKSPCDFIERKGRCFRKKLSKLPARLFEQAKVHLIGKMVDPEKRIVRVHADLKNKKDKAVLVAGMFVTAEIITESATTKVLPSRQLSPKMNVILS